MPDIKFSQLDQLDVAVADDYIPIVDVSDIAMGGNGTNKIITIDNLANSLLDSNDFITKIVNSEYTVTGAPDPLVKTFNSDTATIDDVYDVLASLIQTLKDRQII